MSVLSLTRKLLSMEPAELQFRTSSALRRGAGRVSTAMRAPRWNRSALIGALNLDGSLGRTLGSQAQQRDWHGLHGTLLRHFTDRPARFLLHPTDRPKVRHSIASLWPGAEADASQRASAIAAGRFDVLGYRALDFRSTGTDQAIDWHFDPVHSRRAPMRFWSRMPYLDPSCGDHKIIWELNRHQYWLTLGRAYWLSGDAVHRETFVRHFDSWMRANPPLLGMNWASMLELALRSLSWLWALHLFADGDVDEDHSPWSVDLLLGLDRQLTLVSQNLSRFFSPNTHLLGEALALYVVGRSLPELRRASTWERLGKATLLDEGTRQIYGDGGHAERSTHYHRYTLDFYLLALAIARRTNDTAAAPLAAITHKLARFARAISDDKGRLPGFGDDDGGMLFPMCGREVWDVGDSLQVAGELLDDPSLAVGAPAEEVLWLTGSEGRRDRQVSVWRSDAFPDTGYYVSRSQRGDHLVVDAGGHGYLNGGHAHADALALTLAVRSKPLLIDPGTACYTVNARIRDHFRSTRYHNTVTVDRRSQSQPAGPFHWKTTTDATRLDWQSGDGFDFFEGKHEGYSPLTHVRSILARPGCWIVIDRISSDAAEHLVESQWHFDPDWNVARLRHGVHAQHADGSSVWLCPVGDDCREVLRGTDSSEVGWAAPVYGSLVPTTTLRIGRRAAAPVTLIMVIVDQSEAPIVEQCPVRFVGGVAADGDAVGVRISTRSWDDVAVFSRLNDGGGERTDTPVTIAGFETDARVACWRRWSGASYEPVVLLDGTIARTPSEESEPLSVGR